MLCLRNSSPPSIRLAADVCATLRRRESFTQPVETSVAYDPPYSASACAPSLSSSSSTGTCTRDFFLFTPASGCACEGGASPKELEEGTIAGVSTKELRGAASDAELPRFDDEGWGLGLRIFLYAHVQYLRSYKRVSLTYSTSAPRS